jgi:hypothetical protein
MRRLPAATLAQGLGAKEFHGLDKYARVLVEADFVVPEIKPGEFLVAVRPQIDARINRCFLDRRGCLSRQRAPWSHVASSEDGSIALPPVF